MFIEELLEMSLTNCLKIINMRQLPKISGRIRRKKGKAAKMSIVDPVGYNKLLMFAASGTSTSTK